MRSAFMMRSSVVVGRGACAIFGCASPGATGGVSGVASADATAAIAVSAQAAASVLASDVERGADVVVFAMLDLLCLSRRLRDRGGLRRGAASHQEPRGYEQPDEPAESHHEHAAHDCLDTRRVQCVHAVYDADSADRDRARVSAAGD